MNDYLSKDEYDRLTIACADLVKKVGGSERALTITGYKQRPQIHRCTCIESEDRRFFPLNAIAEMESVVADRGDTPPVTKLLADMAGFDLARRQDCCPADRQHPLKSIAALERAFADASATISESFADFHLDEDESELCIAKLEKMVDMAAKTMAVLRKAEKRDDPDE